MIFFNHDNVYNTEKMKLLCCVKFFNLKCSAMLQCSANALSSMLQGTAFYLIHRFAHTLKFQNNDELNIVKVYANMYISVNTFDVMCHTFL